MAPHGSARRAPVVAIACTLLVAPAAPGAARAGDPPAAPTLIGDLNPYPRSGSDPDAFVPVGGQVFFSAHTVLTGMELWRTDGTSEGTWLVKEIAPGREGTTSYGLAVGSELFFSAYDLDAGLELWRSNGTAEGTSRIADLLPGPASSEPSVLAAAGDVAFFSVNLGAPPRELWISDGTEAGTLPVGALVAGTPLTSAVTPLTALGERVAFTVQEGEGIYALWWSDGTAEGTSPFPGAPALSAPPRELVPLGDRLLVVTIEPPSGYVVRLVGPGVVAGGEVLGTFENAAAFYPALGFVFFRATHPDTDTALWRTDGTPEGTVPLHPGSLSAFTRVAEIGDALIFPFDTPDHGIELWRSDGSPEGTALVVDLIEGTQGSAPTDVVSIGEDVLFLASLASPPGVRHVFRSDGTTEGTTLVAAFEEGGDYATHLTVAAESVVFAAGSAEFGRELWATLGTPGTTGMLVDIERATDDSLAGPFVFAGGAAHFSISPGPDSAGVPRQAWRADGTVAGTSAILEAQSDFLSRFPTDAIALGGSLLSWSQGLWKLAPGAVEPTLVTDAVGAILTTPGPGVFEQRRARAAGVEWGGHAWFLAAAQPFEFPFEAVLWRSDGRAPGTVPVRNLVWRGFDPRPELVDAGARLFFVVGDSELWTSDGAIEGTEPLRDEILGQLTTMPRDLTPAGDRLFFTAASSPLDRELWTSDGTPEGTQLVADLRPGPQGSNPGPLAALDGGVVFQAEVEEGVRELWWSDGSDAGTRRIEAAPNPLSLWPQFELVRAGSFAYFAAADTAHGRELWRTDGTEEGTALVRDIVHGPAGSHPRELAAWGDRLVFTACDDAGCEPWTSDGTEDGTARYADLVPGPLSSDPATFESDDTRLVFVAGSPEFGREVWWVPEPDGGAAGAVALLVLASLRWRRVA